MSDQPKIVATYDYHDELGNPVYQVVRYEPKDFRVRRANPGKPGEWIWSIEGRTRFLYRHHDISNTAPTVPVIVVEGEKDCESLRQLGLLATTNLGGAGKWMPGDGEPLFQRRVAIIPDRDDAGMRHAAQVAGDLILCGATSVRIVLNLPDMPPKGDVTDWINAVSNSDRRQMTARQKRDCLCSYIKMTSEYQCGTWEWPGGGHQAKVNARAEAPRAKAG